MQTEFIFKASQQLMRATWKLRTPRKAQRRSPKNKRRNLEPMLGNSFRIRVDLNCLFTWHVLLCVLEPLVPYIKHFRMSIWHVICLLVIPRPELIGETESTPEGNSPVQKWTVQAPVSGSFRSFSVSPGANNIFIPMQRWCFPILPKLCFRSSGFKSTVFTRSDVANFLI